MKNIPIPVRDFSVSPKLIVIRSFDVNKPGAEVEELKGGVAGGSILNGVLTLGMHVEIRPGIISRDADGRIRCKPIFSRIVSLLAEQNQLQFAVPGGLIGVGTMIDPTLCRADKLVGQVLGAPGKLPRIYTGKSTLTRRVSLRTTKPCDELQNCRSISSFFGCWLVSSQTVTRNGRKCRNLQRVRHYLSTSVRLPPEGESSA